jgi:hypothetical protein
LKLLGQVLLGGTDPLKLPDHIKEEDQKVMKEFFSRAFSHVLKDTSVVESEDSPRHRNLTLDQAVTLLEQRLDRKRSDEYFAFLFRKFIKADEELDEKFLYLPEPEPKPGPEKNSA